MRSTLATIRGLGWAVLLWAIAAPSSAQNPDVRNIQPFVMLVVDSSGSMEAKPACACNSDTDCSNCEPDCTLANDVNGEPPKLFGRERKKNRWAVTLEALTGKFENFQCNAIPRTELNGMTYDVNYNVKYHQPWDCSGGGAEEVCDYPGTTTQKQDGILDTYSGTLQFGLMTFDGDYTYKSAPQLINWASFDQPRSESIDGMWSHGGLPKKFRYPTCPEYYYVDSGARSSIATEGGLISLNSCPSPPCDAGALNQAIQSALLRTRPYGGTPIAASLDDLYTHLKSEMDDPFKTCRKRYGLLITDGKPDPDFRDLNCDCGEGMKADCPDDPADPDLLPNNEEYNCPYEKPEVLAKKLVQGAGLEPKQLERLFVLGMSVSDSSARAALNDIASNGGNPQRADGDYALFADDPAVMRSNLDAVFSSLLKPSSRSVPAFATGLTGIQYQISAGFQVSAEAKVGSFAPPWVGVIERRQFFCDGGDVPTSPPLNPNSTQGDFFENVLNAQDKLKRDLWTALPAAGVSDVDDLKKEFRRGDAADPCGTGYCPKTSLKDLTNAVLGVADTTEHESVMDWMYGENGSIRVGRRLGDVFHSSPVAVGPPIDESGDDAYMLFRERPEVKERPLVVYVGSNDGVLHAFSVEEFPADGYPLTAHPGTTYDAGQQMWGFVPPMFLGDLKQSLTSHQLMMDGTPVVKDVFFKRGAEAEDTEYHTVLISGMRGGGKGYVALDVTDPVAPKFLWQFTTPEMGFTYGQPEIVQARFKFGARSGDIPSIQTRAVAILPGGVGKKGVSTPGCVAGQTTSMRGPSDQQYASRRVGVADPAPHRAGTQCWEAEGRALYFVDVETGELIKAIHDSDTDPWNGLTLPSPIVGTPTAYQDAVGLLATRGFVMDADGVMWRFDMSAEDPQKDSQMEGWTMRPFHDLFWDLDKNDGQTSYERPILSLDAARNVVVLVGTGNTDNFEDLNALNRVVSLTELSTVSEPTLPEHYQAQINWELRNEKETGRGLVRSELVTGSMALFEGKLYFATFISDSATGDSCDYGRGRMWSVDYLARDPTHENVPYDLDPPASGSEWDVIDGGDPPLTYGPLRHDLPSDDGDAALVNVPPDEARKNLLIQGLGTTQRVTCSAASGTDAPGNYFSPSLPTITQTTPPAIWIVAQASEDEAPGGGSKLGDVGTPVNRGITFSRITSWASSVD